MSEITNNNIYYLKSTSVKKVFPLATSRECDKTSNMFTEMNITNIFKYLFDYPSVVLSLEYENEEAKTLKFILDGYYFEIVIDALLKNWPTNDLYGQLSFNQAESTDTTNPFRHLNGDSTHSVTQIADTHENEIEGGENEKVFGGLTLLSTEPDDKNTPYLHLLTRSGEKWTIPTESRYKFDSTAIHNFTSLEQEVDGGDVSDPKTT